MFVCCARQLFALTSYELRRMQDRVLLLIKSAQERVASFLLEMADRAAAGNVVELPMSRALLTLAHTRARARGARESGPRFGPRRRRFIFGEFVLLGSPGAVAAAL